MVVAGINIATTLSNMFSIVYIAMGSAIGIILGPVSYTHLDVYKRQILQGVVNGLATSIGFFIAIVIMAGIREKIEYNDIPKRFQGTAIVLITAALMSIAFMGFSGMI